MPDSRENLTTRDDAAAPDDAAARASIAQWCRDHVADILEQPVSEIDLDADFDRLGVDSAVAVSLLIAVEDHYGVDVAPEALFENPTLNALAAYLYDQGAPDLAQR